MNWIYQPWHWSVSGLSIGLILFILLKMGKNFGMSSNLRTLCSMSGAGKYAPFFNFDWKAQRWNLYVVLGAILGGWIAQTFLSPYGTQVAISEETILKLNALGFKDAGLAYLPKFLFDPSQFSIKSVGLLFLGGLLVGFGARYAGGCTSGHAISGLSNLQVPSLIAVVGFFMGGLVMIHFIIGTALAVGVLVTFLIKKYQVQSLEGKTITITPKQKSIKRYLFGGIIFGLGWALAGACPGPMFTLLGTGAFGILIVLTGAFIGTLLYGFFKDQLPH